MTTPALDPHPFALLTPDMSGEQRYLLLADVIANGVKDPIVLFEGKILDGVNRYWAHQHGGGIRELPITEFEGGRDEALAFVLSKNMHRRHMTPTERANLGARVFELADAEPALKEGYAWRAISEAVTAVIERPLIDKANVWPPREGFPVTYPETLKEFARKHGRENVAVEPIPEDGTFDNEKAREYIQSLVTDGYLEQHEIPVDVPAPEKVSETYKEVLHLKTQNPKGGRPKNPLISAVKAMGVSRATATRRAKVSREGSPELKQALEANQITVTEAAKIAALPKEQQSEVLHLKTQNPPARKSKVPALIKQLEAIAQAPREFISAEGKEGAERLLHAFDCVCTALAQELRVPE
jgi:hypothetical protein